MIFTRVGLTGWDLGKNGCFCFCLIQKSASLTLWESTQELKGHILMYVFKKHPHCPEKVVLAFNLSTQKTEVGGSLSLSQPGLQKKFETSQRYKIEKQKEKENGRKVGRKKGKERTTLLFGIQKVQISPKCVKIAIILHVDNYFTLNHFIVDFLMLMCVCVEILHVTINEQHSPITKVVKYLLLFLLTFLEQCMCFFKYVLYFRELSS